MKVISQGAPPELQTYTASCGKCHSVLEFQKNEAQVVMDFALMIRYSKRIDQK